MPVPHVTASTLPTTDLPTTASTRSTVWPPQRGLTTYEKAQQVPAPVPPTPHLPRIFTAQNVGGELAFQVLLLEGFLDLERPGVGVLAHQESTPLVRALACLLPQQPGIVVGRATAAWVHTGKLAPHTVDVIYERYAAIPVIPGPANFARSVFEPRDIEVLGPVRVTSPVRTVIDLAAWCSPAQATAHIYCFPDTQQLVGSALADLESRYNFRNRNPALELLTKLLD